MTHTVLVNKLCLSEGVMSNYYWAQLMDDPVVQSALQNCKLYILTQRPVHSFQNILQDEESGTLRFEIHQDHNPNRLVVEMRLDQPLFRGPGDAKIELRGGTLLQPQEEVSHQENHSLMFSSSGEHLLSITPERFLYLNLRGHLDALITGDVRDFLRYKVLYVGKAIDQRVWDRHEAHSTLQRILSVEYPLMAGKLPTHEIGILFLEFEENLAISILDPKDSPDQVTRVVMGNHLPESDAIYTDAEKALIKALSPAYNKEFYKKYPANKGGIYDAGLNTYSYTFMDPITLMYASGAIRGGLNDYGGDAIVINQGKMKVIEASKPDGES